jgi:hypothetical protein
MPSKQNGSTAHYLPADVAAVNNAIKPNGASSPYSSHGYFSFNGILHVPGRGNLRLQPGDYVLVDPQGWPILIPYTSASSASWVHT